MRSGAGLAMAAVCGLAAAAGAQDVRDPVLAGAVKRVNVRPMDPLPGGGADAAGPDVIVGELMSSDSGASLSLNLSTQSPYTNNATYAAYALGTTSCNIGTQNLLWIASSNKHPVIPQNMYKLRTVNGATRFEQVGQSWVKHAFTALAQDACANCSGASGSVLGVNCSDPYTASRNGSQSNPSAQFSGGTGPRYTINPYTGVYPWPVPANPPIADGTSRRIRVAKSDLQVTNASSPVQFFGEAIYVNWDDARWGNGKNNASYRRMFCNNITTSGSFTLEGNGAYNNGIHRQSPAIFAWRDYGNIANNVTNPVDNQVIISDVSTGGVFAQPADPTGDGWFYVGSRATDLGNGMHHYEYAVFNLNSDRGGGSFTVPIPAGVVVTNVEWKGVDSHSGHAAEDATRNDAWAQSINATNVTWSAKAAYTSFLTGAITANSAAGATVITSARHGIQTGQQVTISGSNSVPSIDGVRTVTYISTDTFSIPVAVTTAGTAGTWTMGESGRSTLGNPIRWGTLYNFRFDCDRPPVNDGEVTLGLWKPMTGWPSSLQATAWVPSAPPPPACYANCDESTASPVLNVADFTCFLQRYAANDAYANCDGSTAEPTLNVADFTCFLQSYASGCP